MSVLVFNGIPSTSVRAHIAQPPEYRAPERGYTSINIQGRNGSLIIDSNSYQNVERSYTMSMDASKDNMSFEDVASAILAWLNPIETEYNGYCKLTDSYDPTHFRYARVKGDISINNIFNKAGTFDVTFDCMPQRFLVSGEDTITGPSSSGSKTITNPTSQIARPLIIFTKAQTLTIENSKYSYGCKVKNTFDEDHLIVNCVEEDCYWKISGEIGDYQNGNEYVSFQSQKPIGGGFVTYQTSYDFPVLYPGDNKLTSDQGGFSIIPNWWEL